MASERALNAGEHIIRSRVEGHRLPRDRAQPVPEQRRRRAVLRRAPEAGSRFPRHAHQGTEKVVVLAGAVRIGGAELNAGDDLFTRPGEEHDVVAVSDATIFVSSQKATPVVE
ncbi:MAG: cupin domain-containing protein [Burkholderiales bacterium]